MQLKVLSPKLPAADKLAPYLQRIDASGWYSNSGPLVKELEARMGGVSVSSATLGLELSAGVVFRKLKRVRIPAFTFVATATALIRAGFEPVLCDVGEDWILSDIGDDSLPVCPFGAAVPPGPLVDAAAAWGNQAQGNRVYSLHATKALGAGEGGMVCGSPEVLERVRRLANFGLESTDFSHGVVGEVGTNAKMSEYHAAVALASLDAWVETVAARKVLSDAYRERLTVPMQPRADGVYTSMPVVVHDAPWVASRLAELGIETRRWYTPTLDRHPAFRHLPREGDLRRVHELEASVLCLPFHLHMTIADVDRVCTWLDNATRTHGRHVGGILR